VSPCVIDTPFHDKVSTQEQMKGWAEGNPLKRNGVDKILQMLLNFV
jgi:3-oxoacyl-[acyl-carrier protein] reductase